VCEHTSKNEVGEGLLGMSSYGSGTDLMLVHHVTVVGMDLTCMVVWTDLMLVHHVTVVGMDLTWMVVWTGLMLVHHVTMDPYVLP
jgi:hypothetical protein